MSYPWQEISPKDTIEIETTQALTREDIHVLTKLYQPLIGLKAYTFYMLLFADVNFQSGTKNTRISEILTKLDVGIPDFYEARVHLEGIGLLRIYRSKNDENHYKYQILTPMTAAEFYNDSMLHTMLQKKIGKRLFNEKFDSLLVTPASKEDYEEVTRSFLDVYHFNFQTDEVLNHAALNNNQKEIAPKFSKTIEQTDTFDYKFFKSGLNKHFINTESLTAEIKELINTFHLVYGIDELTMQNLILESADVETGKIDKNKFTKYVETYYINRQQTQSAAPTELLQNKQSERVENNAPVEQSEFSANEQAVINHAKETAPMDYLNSIKNQKGGFVSSNEEWVIKELVERSTLSTEVVNIILHYVLVIKKNVTLEKNYTMTIANDWAQSGVRTAEEAIMKVKNIYKQPRQDNKKSYQKRSYSNYRKKGRKKETLPDWALDTDTAKDDSQIPAEESESLHERLDRLRKLRDAREDD